MTSTSSASDIDINSLTQEVNKEVSKSKDTNNASEYINKCFKTPLLYITTVPLSVTLLIYFMQPDYIYDIDKLTKEKKLNYQKFSTLIIVGTVAMNAFIHYYLIKNCKMKL